MSDVANACTQCKPWADGGCDFGCPCDDCKPVAMTHDQVGMTPETITALTADEAIREAERHDLAASERETLARAHPDPVWRANDWLWLSTYNRRLAATHRLYAEMRQTIANLANAAADLYCARLREGWEAGPNEDDAANLVMHLVANQGIDVHARLMVWRGQHNDEAALAVHRSECDGCAVCDPDNEHHDEATGVEQPCVKSWCGQHTHYCPKCKHPVLQRVNGMCVDCAASAPNPIREPITPQEGS